MTNTFPEPGYSTDMNSGSHWAERAVQQLVRYEALFKLLDDIQMLEDVAAISRAVSRQWKYFASVPSWRLVVANSEGFEVIDGSRGEAQVTGVRVLSDWDAYYWQLQRPSLFRVADPLQGPPPPEFLAGKAVIEIMVLPFARMGYCIALLSAAARHEPFSDLDSKFIRIFGSHFADRVSDILLRARTNRVLIDKATKDGLTGLLNRSAIIERLHSLLALSAHSGQPLSLILCDIDFFKVINDSHGHLAGDKVLREVARRLDAQIRSGDSLGRYGGEEFLAVFYPCAAAEVEQAAERFRRVIAETPFAIEADASGDLTVTISLGTSCSAGGENPRVEDLLKRADDALYRSKARGRNRVTAGEEGGLVNLDIKGSLQNPSCQNLSDRVKG